MKWELQNGNWKLVPLTNASTSSAADHTKRYSLTLDGKLCDLDNIPWAHESLPLPTMNSQDGQSSTKGKSAIKVIICMAILMGLILAGIILTVVAQPEINGSGQTQFQYVPDTSPTSQPYIPTHMEKSDLIIEQNWMCWIGVPGATCDPATRTYI